MRLISTRLAIMTGLAVVIVVETYLLAWPWVRTSLLSQEGTPAERGYQVAGKMGCFTCHGPLGKVGIPNPGSPEGQVPAWSGGTYMMYVTSPDEIREWILHGAPKRVLEDPYYRDQKSRFLVRMPAYDGFLSEQELEDLVAFYKAVAWAEKPPGEAAAGRSVARAHGCFSCHGEEGRARQPNPGSFKGYIPPWQGEDFKELVRDENELRGWILDGGIPRLLENPAARIFIDRQRIQMPAYRSVLKDEEVEQILSYIRWVRQNGPEG